MLEQEYEEHDILYDFEPQVNAYFTPVNFILDLLSEQSRSSLKSRTGGPRNTEK
jgi:hypothetical protein